MSITANYIQPLTTWLYHNPTWALLITFLISFSESLAIIGSIVPGSVTMTAIGILAGSGVMRIDLTIIAATLGAIAGDFASFSLGAIFKHRIVTIWPFKRYPGWLNYGKAYFSRHGGKSVIIGRFIGPLRAIIPLIAGMMQMNRWHFFIANVISALGWSVLYVMPGVFIGAASTELSPELASRLFIVILLLLIGIWLTTLIIKWLIKHTHFLVRHYLQNVWERSKRYPKVRQLIQKFSPPHEPNNAETAYLLFMFGLCFISTITILALMYTLAINNFETLILFFFQSIHIKLFDILFISISFFISSITLTAIALCISAIFLYYQDWRSLYIWASLISCNLILVLIFAFTMPFPQNEILSNIPDYYYPYPNLMIATAMLSFLLFNVYKNKHPFYAKIFRYIVFFILLLSGISELYLGDHWLMSIVSAYLIGLVMSFAHWIIFRTNQYKTTFSLSAMAIIGAIILSSAGISWYSNFTSIRQSYQVHFKQYVLEEETWWSQKTPLLPLHTRSRLGKPKSLLNIQYVGCLHTLEAKLIASGWRKEPLTLLHTLLVRAGGAAHSKNNLLLKTELYNHHKPTLVMIYKLPNHQDWLTIRFWPSNYHLDNNDSIWLGSLQYQVASNSKDKQHRLYETPFNIFNTAVPAFKKRKISIPTSRDLESINSKRLSSIMLIKEPEKQNMHGSCPSSKNTKQ